MTDADPRDEELLTAVRSGDLRAFDRLYARYERRLFGYMLRILGDREQAEDLFQDVVLTVLRDRGYDPARGRFSAWLFTVARNRCLEEMRRARGRDEKADDLPAPKSIAEDPEQSIGRRRQVRAAMAGLPPAQQHLLLLKQVGDLTYREIADIHGVAEGTIKSRLHAAMKAFRERLLRIGEES